MISRDKETFFSVCIFVVVIIPYSDLAEKSSKPRKKNQKNRTEKKPD